MASKRKNFDGFDAVIAILVLIALIYFFSKHGAFNQP